MTTKELLTLPIETFNKAIKLTCERQKGSSASLTECKHCGRLHFIKCICPEAEKAWEDMLREVREVSEQNNREPEYSEDDAIEEIINELDEIGRDYDGYEYGLPILDSYTMGVMKNRIKKILNKLK